MDATAKYMEKLLFEPMENCLMNKKVGFLIMNFESGGGTERVTSVIANELVKNLM